MGSLPSWPAVLLKVLSEVKLGEGAGEGEGHMSVSVPRILHCLDGCGDFHAEELGPGARAFLSYAAGSHLPSALCLTVRLEL